MNFVWALGYNVLGARARSAAMCQRVAVGHASARCGDSCGPCETQRCRLVGPYLLLLLMRRRLVRAGIPIAAGLFYPLVMLRVRCAPRARACAPIHRLRCVHGIVCTDRMCASPRAPRVSGSAPAPLRVCARSVGGSGALADNPSPLSPLSLRLRSCRPSSRRWPWRSPPSPSSSPRCCSRATASRRPQRDPTNAVSDAHICFLPLTLPSFRCQRSPIYPSPPLCCSHPWLPCHQLSAVPLRLPVICLVSIPRCSMLLPFSFTLPPLASAPLNSTTAASHKSRRRRSEPSACAPRVRGRAVGGGRRRAVRQGGLGTLACACM